MKSTYLFLIGFLLLLLACEEKPPAQIEIIPLPEILHNEILSRFQNCNMDSLSCTYALIIFPQFSDSTKTELNYAIKNKMMAAASGFMKEGSEQSSLEEVADTFVNDYENFINEFKDYDFGWYLKIGSYILYNTDKYLSFRVDVESFTGGAHANSSSAFFVLDAVTKRELKINDIVSDTVQFKQQLEQAFREQTGLEEDETFADAGYWIEEGDFYINNNIGLTENKVIVHFNPYEIAPYSLGSSTIELDRKEVDHLLKVK